jgi:hypothetical protein
LFCLTSSSSFDLIATTVKDVEGSEDTEYPTCPEEDDDDDYFPYRKNPIEDDEDVGNDVLPAILWLPPSPFNGVMYILPRRVPLYREGKWVLCMA